MRGHSVSYVNTMKILRHQNTSDKIEISDFDILPIKKTSRKSKFPKSKKVSEKVALGNKGISAANSPKYEVNPLLSLAENLDEKQVFEGIFEVKKTRNMAYLIQRQTKRIYRQTENIRTCGHVMGSYVDFLETSGGVSTIRKIKTCGSVHACPVCQSKILGKRQADLKLTWAEFQSVGGTVYMLTLTAPHKSSDFNDLEDYRRFLSRPVRGKKIRKGLMPALSKFKGHRIWRETISPALSLVADLRVIESTVGIGSGFHPHFHIALFCRAKLEVEELNQLQSMIYELWAKSCVSAGVARPSRLHGVNLQLADHADQYLAKWGLVDEMASNAAKEGKKQGRFSIAELQLFLVDESRRLASGLSREQIRWFLSSYYMGMHGKRLMHWGGPDIKAFKKLHMPGHKEDDKELAHGEDRELLTLKMRVSKRVYIIILSHAWQGVVKTLLETQGAGSVRSFLCDVVNPTLPEKEKIDPSEVLIDPVELRKIEVSEGLIKAQEKDKIGSDG